MGKFGIPLVLAVSLIASPLLAAGDADAGAQVFKKCQSCHSIGDGAKNKTGPVLTGVIGRKAGTYSAYRYSTSMTAAGKAGLVWSEDLVFEYLLDPTAFLQRFLGDKKARAKMSFHLNDEQDRRNVAAYLATFSN